MPDPTSPKTPKAQIVDSAYSVPWGRPAEQNPDAPIRTRHFGKYRGQVLSAVDPLDKGRLLVSVPGVLARGWALPCVPLADVMLGTFIRPRVLANVWVEFEHGDPKSPIWVGTWWADGTTPTMAKAAEGSAPGMPLVTLETETAGISICDAPLPLAPVPGQVVLSAGKGAATISISESGVTITANTITILGAQVGIEATQILLNGTSSVTVTTPQFNVAAGNLTVK